MWGAHQVDARISAKNAVKIRAALRQSIDARQVYEMYQSTSPAVSVNNAQDRARARAWAIMNVKFYNEALRTALMRLFAEAWVTGEAAAGEAIYEEEALRKAGEIGVIDWSKWQPGDKATALLLEPTGAFKKILDKTGTTITGLDKTGYELVGNALADSIRAGYSPRKAAKLIQDTVGSPARALSIAVTESSRVMNSAAIDRYREAGIDTMQWAAVQGGGTSVACEKCAENAGEKRKIGQPFTTGVLQPPQHPHCRCNLRPVVPDYDDMFDAQGNLLPLKPNDLGVSDIMPNTYAKPTEYGKKRYESLLKDTDYDSDFRYAAQRWQGEDYRRVQSGLSSGKLSNLSDEVREIVDLFDDNMMSLEDADDLFRGLTEGLDNLKVGDTFKSPLYQATTTDPITAAGFSKSSGSVLGGIKEGEMATILRIDAFDAKGVVIPSSSEFEVVLARGTRYEVEDISEEVINGVKLRIIDVTAVSK